MRLPAPYDRMLAPVYVPSFLMALSQQALQILLPLYVLELGGSAAFAAFVVGLRGVGVLAFDVPAGMLVGRFGEKPVLIGGLVAVTLGMLMLVVAPGPWWLALSAVPLGVGAAAWMLGRQSYVTEASAPEEVGRAFAVMAGLQRVGGFIGPAAGGIVAELLGYPVAFIAGAVCALLAGMLVVIYTRHVPPAQDVGDLGLAGTIGVVRSHGREFATAGLASLTLQLMRATRQVLIPLFGVAIGLDAAAIGAIYSLSAAVDMSLFYPVGVIADRWGRKWISVPSMLLFAFGLALLPLVDDFYSLLAGGVFLGLANGVSTGIVMIIGADLAPPRRQGQFLGVWRLIGDVGMSGGPLLTGLLVDVASLGAASLTVAGAGFAGLLVMAFLVPETRRRLRPADAEGAGAAVKRG